LAAVAAASPAAPIAAQPPSVAASDAEVITTFALAMPAARRLDACIAFIADLALLLDFKLQAPNSIGSSSFHVVKDRLQG
jgi:hypothetical protein